MPTREQAKKAWEHGRKGKPYYDALTPEQKSAFWSYGRDNGYISRDNLDDYKRSEFDKCVKTDWAQYAPKVTASHMQDALKADRYANYQGPKVPLTQPKQPLASPQNLKAAQTAITPNFMNPLLNTKLEPKPKELPKVPQKGAKQPTKNENKMVPVGKAGIIKTQARNFSNADAFVLGAGDSLTLGAFNKQLKDDSIKDHSLAFGAGQVAGYIAPTQGALKIAGRPAAKAVGKVVGKKALGKLATTATEGLVTGALVDTASGLAQGERGSDLTSRVKTGALWGIGIDLGLAGLGVVGKAISKKLANAAKGIIEPLTDAERAAVDKLPQEVKQQINDVLYVDPYGNVKNTPEPTLLLNAPKNIETLKQPNIVSQGKYKIVDPIVKKAESAYDDAVREIQRYYNDTYITSDELKKAQKGLAIDFDKLVSDLEQAQNRKFDIRETGNLRRMMSAAGVKMRPSLGLGSKLNNPSNVAEQYKRETPFTVFKSAETPAITQKPLSNINTPPIENKAFKSSVNNADEVAVGAELANDPIYKELIDELQGVKAAPDNNIKSVAPQIKDRAGLTLNLKDVYRNMRDTFGKSYDYVKKNYLDPFDASKKAYTDEVKTYTDDIYNKVVKGLGINKGTKESAAVQNFGEGLITKEQLVKDFGEQKAKQIIEADGVFRKAYDELINKVNASRAQIYPNNPDKLVQPRKDYYRHFNEMAEGFKGLKNIFETPSQIDPKLAGMSEFTKPNSRWASFMQKRGEGDYTADAVGGFLNYIQPASYSIHIDPHISKFRNLAKDIAEATQTTKNANNTIKYLNDFANSLAGKTSKYDRVLQEDIPGGRVAFSAINWLNSRVKANQVLMNAQSAISQFANVPVGMARNKDIPSMTKGLGQTLAGIVGKGNKAMKQSQYINERYMSDLVSRFDKKLLNQPKKFAAWLLEGADKLGTGFTWNSAYNKAVAKGIENPVKYADDFARSITAGRGIGEVPLLQQAKTFQLIAPFQLEVANLWHVFGDAVKEKDFAGIALILLGNYMFNNITENTTGNRATFDPVNAFIDAIMEDDATAGKVAGRMAGEVLSNVPLGQTMAAQYPEYGADISTPFGSVSLPSRKAVFGDEDPTRFGGGLLVTKALTDPLYKIAAPFGGAQAKKTIEGIKSVNQGMVAKNGKMSFPVDKNLENYVKGGLFGKYATTEAREYFDKDRRPLSEKQTAELLKKPNLKSNYDKLMDERRINTLNDKIKEINKNKTLSWEEKQKKIIKLMSEISTIRKNS